MTDLEELTSAMRDATSNHRLRTDAGDRAWSRGRRRRQAIVSATAVACMAVAATAGVVAIQARPARPTQLQVSGAPPVAEATVATTPATSPTLPSPTRSSPAEPSTVEPLALPVTDGSQQPATSYAGRSLAQLAQECQTWAPGIATPGAGAQIRGLVADSAGAVAAITTGKEASTCDFLPDGSVDTSGANDGPYGVENPANRLVLPVDPITLGSGITHRTDSKDRGLVTPVRDTLVARVSHDVAYLVVDFDGYTVRSTPGQGVVTATHITGGKVVNVKISYVAYDSTNHVVFASEDAAADYGRCDPKAGAQKDDSNACPAMRWP